MARKSRRKVFDMETMTYHENSTVEENTNKTAIYARLSRKDNGVENGTALENQIEYISKSLERFSDINVVDVYSDNGFSGVDFNRDSWERLINDIKANKINCIAVKDLSRIGRNSVEVGNYLEKVFPFLNVRVISINDNFDNSKDDYNKKMVENAFKNLMNEFYVMDISKKINANIAARRNMGYVVISNIGYGYKKSADSKSILLDENAPVVKRIFEWRKNGKTMAEIAKILNFLAIPAPGRYLYMQGDGEKYARLKDSKWYSKNIKNILTNRIYTGDLIQNKTFTSKLEGINRRVNSEDDWLIIENFHEALVSREDFEYIQGLNKTISRRPDTVNYLKDKAYCGKCGYMMSRTHTYTKCVSYSCQSNIRKLKELCKVSISEKCLKELLIKLLRNFMNVFVDKNKAAEKIQNSKAFKEKELKRNKEISTLKNTLKEIESKISILYQDFKAEIVSLADFEFIKAAYNSEHKEIETKLNKLMSHNKKINDFKILNKKLERLFSDKNIFNDDKYIFSLVKRITVYSKEKVEIEFTFTDTFKALDDFIADWRYENEL